MARPATDERLPRLVPGEDDLRGRLHGPRFGVTYACARDAGVRDHQDHRRCLGPAPPEASIEVAQQRNRVDRRRCPLDRVNYLFGSARSLRTGSVCQRDENALVRPDYSHPVGPGAARAHDRMGNLDVRREAPARHGRNSELRGRRRQANATHVPARSGDAVDAGRRFVARPLS